jgi:hypothetical protein
MQNQQQVSFSPVFRQSAHTHISFRIHLFRCNVQFKVELYTYHRMSSQPRLLMLLQAAADAASALAVYFGEASSSSSGSNITIAASQDIFAALASFARQVTACDTGLPV